MEARNMDSAIEFQVPRGESLPEIVAYSRYETGSLLEMYLRYKEIGSRVAGIERDISEGRNAQAPAQSGWLMGGSGMINHDPHREQRQEIAELLREQNEVGLAMKFQNPLIWVMYKFEAYRNEERPIRTIHDLVTHDDDLRQKQKIPTLCDKRLNYINRWLTSRQGFDILGFGKETPLDVLAADPRFTSMLLDQQFMDGWREYENHEQGKWYGYNQE